MSKIKNILEIYVRRWMDERIKIDMYIDEDDTPFVQESQNIKQKIKKFSNTILTEMIQWFILILTILLFIPVLSICEYISDCIKQIKTLK